MLIQNDDASARLSRTFESIRSMMDLDSAGFAELMDIDSKTYQQILQGNKEVSVYSVMQLLKHVPVSFERLFSGNIDYSALRSHFYKDYEYVPERYRLGAFSKRRTSFNMISYAAVTRGDNFVDLICRQFQIHPEAVQRMDERISIQFGADLCEYLKKFGFNDRDFFQMGIQSAAINMRTPLGKRLSSERTLKEAYELIFSELIHLYDENWDYRLIGIGESGAWLVAKPHERVTDALKKKQIGSVPVCRARAGVLASYPMFLGYGLADVDELECVHRGDAECVYHMRWDHLHLNKRRPVRIVGESFAS